MANATNGRGIVVGTQLVDGRRQAVAWVLGVPVPLGDPAGTADVLESNANDVDALGRVVGTVQVPGRFTPRAHQPVVWDLGPVARHLERLLR